MNASFPGENANFGDPELIYLFRPGRQARSGLCRQNLSPDCFSPDLFFPGEECVHIHLSKIYINIRTYELFLVCKYTQHICTQKSLISASQRYMNAFVPGENADFGDPELICFWAAFLGGPATLMPGKKLLGGIFGRRGRTYAGNFPPDLFSPHWFSPGKTRSYVFLLPAFWYSCYILHSPFSGLCDSRRSGSGPTPSGRF